jgi:hypothetical protein
VPAYYFTRREEMTFKEHLSLRIRVCSLIFLSELERKSAGAADFKGSKARKRLASFSKLASKKGCALDDIIHAYIFGCIYRKKAIYGVNFHEALDLYERGQLSKRLYNQPTKLYQEIRRFEMKNQAGITKVYRLEVESGNFVKGKYLYDIAGKDFEPMPERKGFAHARYIVQEENRIIIGAPSPEEVILQKEINRHWFKIIISLLRRYKASLTDKSRKTLEELIICPFSAEYLSSVKARRDKEARQFTFALDNLHRNSLFRGKINRVDYLNLLRKYNNKL